MLTTTELQAARKEAALRLLNIGMAHLPQGWTFKYRKSLSGLCHYRQKRIDAPKPVTRKALYIWLHECAHAVLQHGNPDLPRKPRHREEYEAEMWAHEKMRAAGVAVPREMTEWAQDYVLLKCRQAVTASRGRVKLCPEALAFAKRSKKWKGLP